MKFLTKKGQPFCLSFDSLNPPHENKNLKKTFQNSISISFFKNHKLLIQSLKRYKLSTPTLYLDGIVIVSKSLPKAFFCKLITLNELSSLYRAFKYIKNTPPISKLSQCFQRVTEHSSTTKPSLF